MTARPSPHPRPKTYATAAALAIQWAFAHLGLPYGLGGDGSPGSGVDANGHRIAAPSLDCSGMTLGAWRYATDARAGLAHFAAWQYWETARIFHEHIQNLRPGDLVFYDWNGIKSGPQGHASQPGGPNHVNIFLGWYAGHQWCVQATTFGVESEVIPIDAYERPYGYGRVKFADWDRPSSAPAVYNGAHIDTRKWARFLAGHH